MSSQLAAVLPYAPAIVGVLVIAVTAFMWLTALPRVRAGAARVCMLRAVQERFAGTRHSIDTNFASTFFSAAFYV